MEGTYNASAEPSSRSAGPNGGFGTGLNLLMVIIYGAMTVLLVAIFVQRALLRNFPKFSKGHTDVGKYAPQSLKADIEKRLMRTLHVAYEPTLLTEDDKRHNSLVAEQEVKDGSEAEEQHNYLYRMKTLDDMKKLEDALCRADDSLKRHPFKDLKLHLRDVKSHSSGVMRTVRSSQIKTLTDAYEHARYKAESYGKKEYNKFLEVLNDVLAGIEHKVKKKKSRKTHSQKNSNNSRTEGPASVRGAQADDIPVVSESEPLLISEDVGKKKK